MYTHLDMVQLVPSDDHRAFSSLFRCSCRKEMPPTVMAGLSTDAAMAGPPVVLTICESRAAVSVAKEIGKEWEIPRGFTKSTRRTYQVKGNKDGMHQLMCIRLCDIRLESCLNKGQIELCTSSVKVFSLK